MASVTKRGQSYYAAYMVAGRRYQYVLPGCTTRAQALARANADQQERKEEARKAASKRRTPSQAVPLAPPVPGSPHPDMTVLEAARLTHLQRWSRRKRGDAALRNVEHCVECLGHDPRLSELDNNALAVWQHHLHERYVTKRGGSPTTVNRYMAALVTVLRRANGVWGVLPWTPMVESYSEAGNERERVISEEEVQTLCASLRGLDRPLAADLCIFLLDTGARLGEALGLRWEDCDMDGRRLHFRGTKNGSDRHLSMSARVARLLTRMRDVDGQERPFPHVASWYQEALRKARSVVQRETGRRLDGVIWHAFRHTCASRLTMAGVGQHRVTKWMGWKSPSMFARYAHLDPKAYDEVATVVDGWATSP